MRTISVEAEVDVDLDDYINEFLEGASNQESKEQLENRGYLVFKGKEHRRVKMNEPISFDSSQSLKRHLCDIAEIGYFSSNEELLNAIKSRL